MYELYCDYVLKNPFHEMDQVGRAGRRAALCVSPSRALSESCQHCCLRADCTNLLHPLHCAAPPLLRSQVIKSELFDSNLVAALSAANRRWAQAA